MDDSRISYSLNLNGSGLVENVIQELEERDNITFKNVTIENNLEVDGEEIINEIETFKVKDAIVEFNNASPAVNADTGFTSKENIAGNTRYKGLIFKSGQDVGIVYNNASTEPLTTLEQPYDLGTVRVRDANSQNEPITKQQFDNNTVKLSGNQNISGVKTFNTDTHLHKAKFINPSTQDTDRAIYSDENGDLVFLNESSTGDHTFYTMQGGTETLMLRINAQTNQIDCLKKLSMNGNRLVSVGAPSLPGDAATKQYVDDNAPTDYVNLTTNQTVGGEKTFTNTLITEQDIQTNKMILMRSDGSEANYLESEPTTNIMRYVNGSGNNKHSFFNNNSGTVINTFNINFNHIQSLLPFNMSNNIIYGLAEPVDDDEAATKKYVDDNIPTDYVNLSTNQNVGGEKTFTNKMTLDNTSAGMQSLLRFESARPWEFRTNNTGSGTSLELYSTAPEKGFKITTLTETSGDQDIAQFSESSVSIYTQQNLNDNDILDIDEAQVKRLTLIKPDDGNKSVASIRMVGNYISYDSLINSSFGGHRFYVKDGANDVMALQITRNHIDTNYKLNMGYNKIEQLAEPTANTDAATKNYVDNAVATAGSFNSDINLNDNNIQNINEAEAKKLILIRPSDNNKNVSSIYMESNYIRYDNLVNSGAAGHRFYTFNGFTNDLAFRIANSFIESSFELRMGNQKIEELAEPVVGSDAATKNYVDNIARSYSATVTSLSMSCSNLPIYSSYNVGAFNLTKTGHYMIDYTINIRQNEPTLTDRHFAVILTAPGSVGNLSAPGGARGIDLSRTGMISSSMATGSINLKWIVEYTSTGIKQLTMDIGSRSGSGTPFEFYGNAIISRVVV